MLIKHDSSRLNNTESFYILFLAMLTLLSVLFLLAKGFRQINMPIFVFYHIFALNIYRVYIQVSVDVLLRTCFKKALLN